MTAEAQLPVPLGPLAYPRGWDALPASPPVAAVAAAPRITLVTTSLNQAPYLEATIRSVLAQAYPHLDYYVVDGGSRDGSLEIIQHYRQHLAGGVSEPDGGQVHAILKGLAVARGEWFNWINSDDLLAPGALAEVARLAPDAELIAGATQDFRGDAATRLRICRNLTARDCIRMPLDRRARWHQPGIWYRTQRLRAITVDTDLHCRFDLDLLIRYLRKPCRVGYSPRTLAWFRQHAAAKSTAQNLQFGAEHRRILQRYLDDPEFADLHGDVTSALAALDWRREMRALEADVRRSRWHRASEVLRRTARAPAAWHGSAVADTLWRILLRGGKP